MYRRSPFLIKSHHVAKLSFPKPLSAIYAYCVCIYTKYIIAYIFRIKIILSYLFCSIIQEAFCVDTLYLYFTVPIIPLCMNVPSSR